MRLRELDDMAGLGFWGQNLLPGVLHALALPVLVREEFGNVSESSGLLSNATSFQIPLRAICNYSAQFPLERPPAAHG